MPLNFSTEIVYSMLAMREELEALQRLIPIEMDWADAVERKLLTAQSKRISELLLILETSTDKFKNWNSL